MPWLASGLRQRDSEEAYYYGNWLMALSLYARTGGPGKGADGIPDDADLMGLTQAIDKLTAI